MDIINELKSCFWGVVGLTLMIISLPLWFIVDNLRVCIEYAAEREEEAMESILINDQ